VSVFAACSGTRSGDRAGDGATYCLSRDEVGCQRRRSDAKAVACLAKKSLWFAFLRCCSSAADSTLRLSRLSYRRRHGARPAPLLVAWAAGAQVASLPCAARAAASAAGVRPASRRGVSSHTPDAPLLFVVCVPAGCNYLHRCWFGAGAARSCAARLASHAACGLPQALYNRLREKRVLELRLAEEPTALLVFLGPPSCGKTGAPSHLWRHGSLLSFLTRLRQRCSRSCCASAPSSRARSTSTVARGTT
jgi:hypothetical protein